MIELELGLGLGLGFSRERVIGVADGFEVEGMAVPKEAEEEEAKVLCVFSIFRFL